MKRNWLLTIGFWLLAFGTSAQRTLFDNGWQFIREGKTVSVDLPHDWAIFYASDPATGASGTDGGWYPGGKGEYKKLFSIDNGKWTMDHSLVKMHFEGVYQKAEVFINGQKAGQHAYGYTPFTVDITPYLYRDKRQNEVLVKVDNREQPNCRWYTGSGIYRHVWLETMPALHIAENGVFVTTPEISSDKAVVRVDVTVQNESDRDRNAVVAVGVGQMTVSVPAHQQKTVSTSFIVRNPHLWSPDDPFRYEVKAELKENGNVVHQQSVNYGVRSFTYDAEKGFVLNGKPLLINGACVHHDDGVLGAMAFDAAEIRKVRQMKDAGFNLIRTSHNPTTRAFLDACDSIGMLVIGEAFDGWRTAKKPYDYSTLIDSCYQEDIRAMVERDRNHPSIICWSIGNEVIERKDIRVVHTAKLLKQAILDYDTTRPVTEALCAWDSDWEIYDPHFDVLDIGGYNYMIHKHASDHQRNPKRVMWQTESYPRDAFKNWKLVRDYPYVIGDIVWTGLDYLGESGIGRNYYDGETPGEHWREGGVPEWHGAYCGDVDITGWRKPISHYREMLWNAPLLVESSRNTPLLSPEGDVAASPRGGLEGGVYLAVREPDGYCGKINMTAWSVWPTWESWNWPGWEGKPIEVEVYTKAPEVKLYLNDKLIGTKAVSEETEYKAVFTVNYEPGTLRAEVTTPLSTREGLGVSLQTSGEPAQLRLTADKPAFKADGQDLVFITVEVVDAQGRVCPDAAIPCEATVQGQGRLMAFATADLTDREPKTSSHVTTWKGRALLVVRSNKNKGKATVSIKSSLPKANLTIKSK